MRGYDKQGASAWLWGLGAQLCEEADKAREVSGRDGEGRALLGTTQYARAFLSAGRPPRRKATVSSGGDATDSLDAELELPE